MKEGLMLKIICRIIYSGLRLKGITTFNAMQITKVIRKDLTRFPEVSLLAKFRGYFDGYLTDTNLRRHEIKDGGYFIPELKYFNCHPINGAYSSWIDDKLILKYILAPFSEFLPIYYYHLTENNIYYLDESQKNEEASISSIIKLVRAKKKLAIKPLNSTGGAGFLKLEFENESYKINNDIITETELYKQLGALKNHLVCEFVEPETSLMRINPYSTNTMRINVVRYNNKTYIISAYIRFGTSKSGIVDNITNGGIFTAVDIVTGKYDGPARGGKATRYKTFECHPDTAMEFNGTIKNWALVKQKIDEIGNYVPHLIHMGYDIAITDDGFKILEINSLQELLNVETYFSLPIQPVMVDFYDNLFKEKLR